MEAGYLVEFFDQRRILCGIVLELKGERLHVLAQTNRELTLARKRVLHACPSPMSPQMPRQQLLNYLEETASKREALKDSIRLEELWDLLAQENQALSVQEMADLWFGEVTADQVAALERALLADRFQFLADDLLFVITGLWGNRQQNLPQMDFPHSHIAVAVLFIVCSDIFVRDNDF